MRKADYHPCFSCTLPDCDESSPRCGLKTAEARFQQLKARGETVPEDVRLRRAAAHQERYGQFRRKARWEGQQ